MSLSPRGGLILLGTILTVAVAVSFQVEPFGQDPAYHEFADTRAFFGLANSLDVASNLGFLLVGLFGLRLVWALRNTSPGSRYIDRFELLIWSVLFGGITLVAVGSGYYHLSPTNDRLVWDRLPMTVAFTALFSMVIYERVSPAVAKVGLFVFVGLGIWSVLAWHTSEQQGAGDLRFYAAVQFVPLLSIPILLWLLPPRYSHGSDLVAGLGWYILAKVFELLDTTIYAMGELVSGHTLKHMAAGLGCWWIARMIARRRALPD